MYVTWVVPSARLDVPKTPTIPLAAFGCEPPVTVNGGQSWAQAPVHELCPFWSAVKRYKVAPEALTRIIPRVGLVVDPMTVAGTVAAFDPVFEVLDTADVGDEPQAAATSPTDSIAPTAKRRDAGLAKSCVHRRAGGSWLSRSRVPWFMAWSSVVVATRR